MVHMTHTNVNISAVCRNRNCHELYSGDWAEWSYSYCMQHCDISSLRRRRNYPSHLICCDKVVFLLSCLVLGRLQYIMLRSGSYCFIEFPPMTDAVADLHTHTQQLRSAAITNKKKPEEVFFPPVMWRHRAHAWADRSMRDTHSPIKEKRGAAALSALFTHF